MYLLSCNSNLQPVMNIIHIVITAIQIGVPIILIIFGMIDLGKAVISSKDDEVKKAQKSALRRLIYAVAVFLVVWLVKLVMSSIPKIFPEAEGTSSWQGCWACISSPKSSNCVYADSWD